MHSEHKVHKEVQKEHKQVHKQVHKDQIEHKEVHKDLHKEVKVHKEEHKQVHKDLHKEVKVHKEEPKELKVPKEVKVRKELRDIFHPDNVKREDRVKNLSAQMDQQLKLIIELSGQIELLGQQISKDLQDFQNLVQKVLQLIPSQNQSAKKKLQSLKNKITHLNSYIQVNVVPESPGLYVINYIAQLLTEIAVDHYLKAIRNAYIKKLMLKQGKDYTDDIVRKAFVQKLPRWNKWKARKVGGFLAGSFFLIALELAFAGLFGTLKKEQLQNVIEESLDCRYYAVKAKLINQICVDSFYTIKGNILGGKTMIKLIQRLFESGISENIEKAYTMLAGMKIEETLDDVIKKTQKVDHALIIKATQKMDSYTTWKDNIEASWKPVSEQEFMKKYPPS